MQRYLYPQRKRLEIMSAVFAGASASTFGRLAFMASRLFGPDCTMVTPCGSGRP